MTQFGTHRLWGSVLLRAGWQSAACLKSGSPPTRSTRPTLRSAGTWATEWFLLWLARPPVRLGVLVPYRPASSLRHRVGRWHGGPGGGLLRHRRGPCCRRTPCRGAGVGDVGEPGPRALDLHGVGAWRLRHGRVGAP